MRISSAAANGKHEQSLISAAKFRQLFELALKVQLLGSRGDGVGMDWLRGREAVVAGVAADLRADDGMVAKDAESLAHLLREHVPFGLAKRSFEERVIEALSEAVADRMRKTGRVRVILSEGTGKGARAIARAGKVMEEAWAIASSAKLAMLFVEDAAFESNGKPKRKGKAKGPAEREQKKAGEMPAIPVDMQDVVAVYRVAHESIARAREGAGPTRIVAMRWVLPASGRKGAGASIGVESEDAVAHLEHWLTARGLPALEWRREIVAEFEALEDERIVSAHNAVEGENEIETQAIA
jgi:hypothetical protein